MASQSHPEKKLSPRGKKILARCLTLAIVVVAVLSYLTWLRWVTEAKAPPMVMPLPYVYEDIQPVTAALLWQEELVYAPARGEIQFARDNAVTRVAKGETVATVLSRGRTQAVQAPLQGYFIPAWDGAEGVWTYGALWPGSEILPTPPPLQWLPNLGDVPSHGIVGKLLPLPQRPRAIFYADLTQSVRQDLQRGHLDFRLQDQGAKWRGVVRVFLALTEHRVKVALELPFFPPQLAQSRRLPLLICAGESDGLLVPESSVILKEGSYGVYELVGDRLVFRPVTGRPMEKGMFFVASGLRPGNPVILHGADAVERRVQLW